MYHCLVFDNAETLAYKCSRFVIFQKINVVIKQTEKFPTNRPALTILLIPVFSEIGPRELF